MITQKQISVAIHYLFPELKPSSNSYRKIAKFIYAKYARLFSCALYYRNKEFMALIEEEGLSIGSKEVIITSHAVRASENFCTPPEIIFEKA